MVKAIKIYATIVTKPNEKLRKTNTVLRISIIDVKEEETGQLSTKYVLHINTDFIDI